MPNAQETNKGLRAEKSNKNAKRTRMKISASKMTKNRENYINWVLCFMLLLLHTNQIKNDEKQLLSLEASSATLAMAEKFNWSEFSKNPISAPRHNCA